MTLTISSDEIDLHGVSGGSGFRSKGSGVKACGSQEVGQINVDRSYAIADGADGCVNALLPHRNTFL